MTVGALDGSRLIEQDILTPNRLYRDMAGSASHLLVCSLQRKDGFLVVERSGAPLGALMAIQTTCDALARKLSAMSILMALLTHFRGLPEISVPESPFQVRRTVTFGALHSTVRTCQRELGSRVVELTQIAPGLRGMACLATGGVSV